MTSHMSQRKIGFWLPPDVSYENQPLFDAWAYVFRHRVLGELGRILIARILGFSRLHAAPGFIPQMRGPDGEMVRPLVRRRS
jgi:hypothetical protein